MTDQLNVDIFEKDLIDVFEKHHINYQQAALMCMNIFAFACMQSGLPFEVFHELINELTETYEEYWPIG